VGQTARVTTDWVDWHTPYDDPDSPLSARLRAVRAEVAAALDRAPAGPLRLLSLCAGQGRDVLPLLREHPRGPDVRARLVEADGVNVAAARAAAGPEVEVVEGDAGTTDACAGAVPADVLLLCGIFGNVGDADVRRTLLALPMLLAPGGTVLWTRSRHAPDLTPTMRGWQAEVGVEQVAFVAEPGQGWSVGAGVLRGPAQPLVPGQRLFTFTTRPPQSAGGR